MRRFRAPLLLAIVASLATGCSSETPPADTGLTFTVAADMREFTGATEFRGAVEAIRSAGAGSFMISPGDIDPPGPVHDVITSILGSSYTWYPVVGNHESETPEDMAWLRAFNPGGAGLPRIANPGPSNSMETCYSFNWGPGHFVVINEYFDSSIPTDSAAVGDVRPGLLTWLQADLAASSQPLKLVFGHEPGWPQPDFEPPHRLRHLNESLDKNPTSRDAFWAALVAAGVKAYICGHTHDCSITMMGGVWQIDAGHARGKADTGAPSTFLRMIVGTNGELSYEIWRLEPGSTRYEKNDWGTL